MQNALPQLPCKQCGGTENGIIAAISTTNTVGGHTLNDMRTSVEGQYYWIAIKSQGG